MVCVLLMSRCFYVQVFFVECVHCLFLTLMKYLGTIGNGQVDAEKNVITWEIQTKYYGNGVSFMLLLKVAHLFF